MRDSWRRVFESVEACCNPRRRHTLTDDRSAVDYERLYSGTVHAG